MRDYSSMTPASTTTKTTTLPHAASITSVNPRNILAHEIVGLYATISESSDPSLVGTGGMVVFETRNTISIRTGGDDSRIRQVAKKAAKRIEFQTGDGACFISGSAMIGRPEDRISRLN